MLFIMTMPCLARRVPRLQKGKFPGEYQHPTEKSPWVIMKGPKTWIPLQSFRQDR